MSGIVIEFFGPPASGKSTLARETAERLEREGVDVENPFYHLAHEVSDRRRYVEKSMHVCKALLTFPEYSVRVAWAIRNTEQKEITDVVKNAFNWLYLTGTVNLSDAEVTILDQGLFQSAASITLSGSSEHPLAETISPVAEIPDEYIVVIVNTDHTVLERRLESRRNNPSRVGSRYSLDDYVAAEDALVDDVSRVSDTVVDRFVSVQNNRERDVERNVTRIVNAIEQVSYRETAR